jgi:hypothetical protein
MGSSQMEVNWCDTIALHFGAYAGVTERKDSSVGTARVVVGLAVASRNERYSVATVSGSPLWSSRIRPRSSP